MGDARDRIHQPGGTAVLDPPRPKRPAAPGDERREETDGRGPATPSREPGPGGPGPRAGERPRATAATATPRQTLHALRLLLAASLSTACLVITAMNLTGTGPFRPARPGAAIDAVQTQVERDLAFAVEEIEAYRREHGTLPRDLTPFDFGRERGWTYERLDPGAFRLSLAVGSMRVAWDSRRAEDRDGMDAAR